MPTIINAGQSALTITPDTTGALTLQANGTNALQITANGQITTANAPFILTGGQIQFPATKIASSDANTLDDYEEGSFTPVIVGSTTSGTGTYGAQVGNYTKIGRQVFYQIYFQLSNHTGSGSMFISGLPFAVSSISSNVAYAPSATWMNNLALTANNILMAYPDPGGTTITLNQGPTGGGSVAGIPIDTGFQLMLSGNYFA